MNHIQFNKLHYYVPENWLEVPKDKRMGLYLILNDNISLSMDARIDIPVVMLRALLYLTGITMEQLDEWRAYVDDDTLFEDYLAELASVVFWLFDTIEPENDGDPVRHAIAMNMYGCPAEVMRVYDDTGAAVYLYPPDDEMNNITLGELLKIFSCVEALHGDGDRIKADPEQYDELIASIYRPLNPAALETDRDKRMPLIGFDHLVDQRRKYMWQVHDTLKEMIMFWAQCIRQKYVEGYPNLFQAAQAEGERVGNDYGWAGLIMALAKDITQIREVQNQNAEDAFVYLSYLEDERKRIEKEIERQKSKHGNH